VATATASGDGATNAVPHITGTTATQMLWPEDSIPSTFTVCSVTRYTGGARTRILNTIGSPGTQAAGHNWAHGHLGARGVAHYNLWRTSLNNVGNIDDWLVMCGTNAGATDPGNIILDQNEIGTLIGGVGSARLNINYQATSDWALHSVLIWDYSLGILPVPFHATPYLSIQVTVCVDVSISMVRFSVVCVSCLRAGWP